MILSLMYILGVVSLCACASSHQLAMLLIVSVSLGFYSVLVLFDTAQEIRQLKMILLDRHRRSRVLAVDGQPLTSMGHWLHPLVMSVLYQMSTIENELFSSRIRTIVSEQRVSPSSPAPITHDPGDLHAGLAALRHAFHATGISIVSIEAAAITRLESCGFAGRRFEDAIATYLETYRLDRGRDAFGFFDLLEASVRGSLCMAHGVRYVLCFPLRECHNGISVVCWIGYDESMPPDLRTCDRLREALVQLFDTFESEQMVKQLESRIDLAENQKRIANEFVTHVSHDIRSPLNNVKTTLALLRSEYQGSELELFEIAKKNCDTLEEMVEGVLDFNRFNAGQLKARLATVNLTEITRDVVTAYAVAARQKSIQLLSTLGNGVYSIHADGSQIRRVLSNLLSNAIAYTSVGSITVTLRGLSRERVQIAVTDTGCGMNEGQLSHMFEAFQRFSDKQQGVGLGLTVSKMLTELNNGTISAHSIPGEGSTFLLEFDLVPSRQCEVRPPVPAVQRKTIRSGRFLPRVLLIDDDEELVCTLKRALEPYAREVLTATNVHDAVAICNYGVPEIVITDDGMPDGGGARVVTFLGRYARKARVVVLTGAQSAEIQERYRTFPALEIIQKPIESEALISILSQ